MQHRVQREAVFILDLYSALVCLPFLHIWLCMDLHKLEDKVHIETFLK